jgi:hypothetical protein
LEQEKWDKASASSSISDEAASIREDHQMLLNVAVDIHSQPSSGVSTVTAASSPITASPSPPPPLRSSLEEPVLLSRSLSSINVYPSSGWHEGFEREKGGDEEEETYYPPLTQGPSIYPSPYISSSSTMIPPPPESSMYMMPSMTYASSFNPMMSSSLDAYHMPYTHPFPEMAMLHDPNNMMEHHHHHPSWSPRAVSLHPEEEENDEALTLYDSRYPLPPLLHRASGMEKRPSSSQFSRGGGSRFSHRQKVATTAAATTTATFHSRANRRDMSSSSNSSSRSQHQSQYHRKKRKSPKYP